MSSVEKRRPPLMRSEMHFRLGTEMSEVCLVPSYTEEVETWFRTAVS